MDVIVTLCLLLVAAFIAAWWFSPQLRAGLERPKHSFLANVAAFEQGTADDRRSPASASETKRIGETPSTIDHNI